MKHEQEMFFVFKVEDNTDFYLDENNQWTDDAKKICFMSESKADLLSSNFDENVGIGSTTLEFEIETYQEYLAKNPQAKNCPHCGKQQRSKR